MDDPTTWVDLLGLTGSYIFMFKNGWIYVGKGPLPRALQSQIERAKNTNVKGGVVQGAHKDFGNDKMGLMVEAELMQRKKFGKNPKMLNRINSPGRKLLDKLTGNAADSALRATVNANADLVEAEFDASKGKICK